MQRRRIRPATLSPRRRVVRPFTILATACLLQAACHSGTPAADTGPALTSTATHASTSTDLAAEGLRTSTAVAEPCNLLDHERIAAVLEPDGGPYAPPRTHTGPQGTLLLCQREYGVPGGDLTAFVLRLDLAQPDTIKAQFNALRRTRNRSASAVTVDGLGAGAYMRTDPRLGQQLSAYDGNLHVEITVVAITGAARLAADVRPIMTHSAQQAMDELLSR